MEGLGGRGRIIIKKSYESIGYWSGSENGCRRRGTSPPQAKHWKIGNPQYMHTHNKVCLLLYVFMHLLFLRLPYHITRFLFPVDIIFLQRAFKTIYILTIFSKADYPRGGRKGGEKSC